MQKSTSNPFPVLQEVHSPPMAHIVLQCSHVGRQKAKKNKVLLCVFVYVPHYVLRVMALFESQRKAVCL